MVNTNLMKLCAKLCVLCIVSSLLLGQVSAPGSQPRADGSASQPASQTQTSPVPRQNRNCRWVHAIHKDSQAEQFVANTELWWEESNSPSAGVNPFLYIYSFPTSPMPQ